MRQDISTSLQPILSPSSVAVIGASRDKTSIGYSLIHNLILGDFQGPVFPINPKADSVHSLKSYPHIGAIPQTVDLAVILVPKVAVESVVEECLEAGVKGFVVISAGFAETGHEGQVIESRLRARIREAGARMVGPNCMGVLNTRPGICLDATFAPVAALPGNIGFVSQSGALGVAILNVAADLGLGLTQFVSMGNKADVSGNDLLEYWEEDEATKVIAMYLESFGNPRRFTEIAKRVSTKKPILVVKSGRTEAGARAASSHTGALAGSDVTVSAFLDQCGVVRANTLEELFDIARALDRCPLPAGPRIALVTNAGGPAIMATDACVNLGLEITELSSVTRDRLAAFLPAAASLGNPVDMIASATPEAYQKAVQAVLEDPGVDMVLAINVTPQMADPLGVLSQVTRGAAAMPDKPVLAVQMAPESFYEEIRQRKDLLPVYRFPESAALALAKLSEYAAWKRRPATAPAPFATDDNAVTKLLAATEDGYLSPRDAFSLLELYGIPCAPWSLAESHSDVIEAAKKIGFPVVLKAWAPDLVHKSDLGGVKVDLRTPEELQVATQEMNEKLEAAGIQVEGFLVQRLVRGGHEVIFGVTTDPRLGPLLMFGLGGKYVEVFGDVRFAVPPLSMADAQSVVRGLRGFRLLEGVRGEEAVDLEQLEEILLRLAQLVKRHPRIQELDINPFLAAPEGRAAALDVRIRVTPEE